MKKVMFKQDILDRIRNDVKYHNERDPLHHCTIKVDGIYYSRAFDIPYFLVRERDENSYYIEFPKNLARASYVISKKHVMPYDDFPELEEAFKW